MFSKKITLYNRPNINNKKNNTSRVFLMVIVIAILVIVFVQSISISAYSNSINTSISNESINKSIINQDSNGNKQNGKIISHNNRKFEEQLQQQKQQKEEQQHQQEEIQQQQQQQQQILVSEENKQEEQVKIEQTGTGVQSGQQQFKLFEENRIKQENQQENQQLQQESQQVNQQDPQELNQSNQDNNSNSNKDSYDENDNQVQFQRMTKQQKLIFLEHQRRLQNKVRVPPYSKQKEQLPADIENDKLTKKEREHLTRVVIQEWKDEVEILKNLGYDPGYASIPYLPDYQPPTGDDLKQKLAEQTWKLDSEKNPFLLPKPHIYIHIPKAAGSSLGGIFRRNEKRDLFAHHWMHPNYRELENVVKKDTIFGHIRYGLHNYFERVDPNRLPPNPHGLNKYSYITMLREPVDRVISNYYYHRQNRKDPFHDLAMKYELKDWIKVAAAGNNEQARMICGLGWTDFGNQTIYDMAHHHLKYTFKHVGLTEDFAGSLVLLSHYAGLQNIRFSKVNTGRQRVSVETVPEEVREEIRKRNWIDISLYEMAKDIYNKQIDLIGREFFEKEVEEYKRKYMTRYALPSNGFKG